MTRLQGRVSKGWGYENIFVSNDYYCGKFLHFEKDKEFSMHFHKEKKETWYVLQGQFILTTIDTENARTKTIILNIGDTIDIEPLTPHKLKCLYEYGVILEISTPDSVEDNYKILPGDSQV